MVLDFLLFVLRFIIEVIFLELIAFVGRFAVRVTGLVMRVASFGWLRAVPFDTPDHEFNWLCCRRSGDGTIEIKSSVAVWIGVLIFFIGLAVFLHFFDAHTASRTYAVNH